MAKRGNKMERKKRKRRTRVSLYTPHKTKTNKQEKKT